MKASPPRVVNFKQTRVGDQQLEQLLHMHERVHAGPGIPREPDFSEQLHRRRPRLLGELRDPLEYLLRRDEVRADLRI